MYFPLNSLQTANINMPGNRTMNPRVQIVILSLILVVRHQAMTNPFINCENGDRHTVIDLMIMTILLIRRYRWVFVVNFYLFWNIFLHILHLFYPSLRPSSSIYFKCVHYFVKIYFIPVLFSFFSYCFFVSLSCRVIHIIDSLDILWEQIIIQTASFFINFTIFVGISVCSKAL